METYFQWSLAAAAIVSTIMPVMYTLWFKWHRTTLGRALMTQAIGLAAVLDVAVFRFVLGFDTDVWRGVVMTLLVFGQLAVLFEMGRIKVTTREFDGVEERGDV